MTCQRFHKHTVQQCGLHLLGLHSCNNKSQVTMHILNINIMHLKKKHVELNCRPLSTERLAATVICRGCYVFIGWGELKSVPALRLRPKRAASVPLDRDGMQTTPLMVAVSLFNATNNLQRQERKGSGGSSRISLALFLQRG